MAKPFAKPFDGVRVLDFSRVIAGPYASQMLGLLGAEVIKLEQPGQGDDGRDLSMQPRYAARKYGTVFLSLNAGKRSLGLDLKHPAARVVLDRLIDRSDVLLENFRPGVMQRLGLDYESVRTRNPSIIYCSISGFGQSGPGHQAPAYDGRIQATSGMMSITGFPESGPVRVGFAVCDAATGMTAAFAIASALYRRARTGEGENLDVAMFDTALSFMAPNIQEVLMHGESQPLLGNMTQTHNPTANLFHASEGAVLLSCNNDRQFVALAAALDRTALPDDPRFSTLAARTANAAALLPELESAFKTKDAATWERELSAAGVPCARVRQMTEALEHPQVAHRELLLDLPEPTGLGEKLRVLNVPFKLRNASSGTDLPPPAIGEHTQELLTAIGLDERAIQTLQEAGAITKVDGG